MRRPTVSQQIIILLVLLLGIVLVILLRGRPARDGAAQQQQYCTQDGELYSQGAVERNASGQLIRCDGGKWVPMESK